MMESEGGIILQPVILLFGLAGNLKRIGAVQALFIFVQSGLRGTGFCGAGRGEIPNEAFY